MRHFIKIFLLFFLSSSTAWPQVRGQLSPDSLSAKALLEDILVRRYSQELSTKISSDRFSMSARLDIRRIKKQQKKDESNPLNDLMLGILDPSKLSEDVLGANNKELLNTFLSQYSIQKVDMAVGLNSDISEEKNKEIKQWLDKRLKVEFGNKSQGTVSIIEKKPQPEPVPKTALDHLKDLQNLAGQLALALALLLGAIFLGMFARSATKSATSGLTNTIKETVTQNSPVVDEEEKKLRLERVQQEEAQIAEEIKELINKINVVLPKIGGQFENLINKWCESGEKGLFRLVCFAEAVSKDLGRIPVPVDAAENVKKLFSRMHEVKIHEKREALQRAYWDILTLLNLGEEALAEPFSYLSTSNVETVNDVLMEKNLTMKTLVALYMPDQLRKDFIEGLEPDKKKELLLAATELQSLPANEFKTMDEQMRLQIISQSGMSAENIKFDMPLKKILQGFSMRDQILFLREVPQGNLMSFMRTQPHLAFIDQWPGSPLKRLMTKLNADEIVNYLRIVPGAEQKFLENCPPLTAQMVKDELNRPNELSDNDSIRLLNNMNVKLIDLCDQGEANLQNIFADQTNSTAEAS